MIVKHQTFPDLFSLELIELTFIKRLKKTHMQFHQSIFLAVVVHGEGKAVFVRDIKSIQEGAIIVLPPRMVFCLENSTPNLPLAFKIALIPIQCMSNTLMTSLQTINLGQWAYVNANHDELFQATFLEFFSKMTCECSLITQSVIFERLLEMFQQKIPSLTNNVLTKVSNLPVYLEKSIHYLIKNYKAPFNLNELADMASKSSSQLLRAFQKYIGISPNAYQTNLKIIESKRLLINDTSIAQVAFELGFTDQSHFYRYFKRYYLITPGSFKRMKS